MGIIENAKDAVKLVQQIDNIELYRKILDLQAEAIELTDRLKEKDEIINQLREALELKGKFICKDSAYYIADESGKIIDGPFCTKCFDVDHTKCRLVAESKEPQIICPNCKVSFSSKPVYDYLRPDVEERRKKNIERIRNLNRTTR
ncbi:MAG: hypothetical protein ACYSRR_01275 [Planctomycetota bacterium]|jgi:hypothetical protein